MLVRNHSYKVVFRLEVHFHGNQTYFHMKGFAVGLIFKQRHFDSEITINSATFACSKMKVKRTEKRSIAWLKMMGTRLQTQPSMKKMQIVKIQVRSRDACLSNVIRKALASSLGSFTRSIFLT